MKKVILFAAVIGLSAVSCTKDRVCTCTESSTATGSTSQTYSYTLVGSTKGQAKANCVSTKETGSTGIVTTTDCKLK
jgi:hypothetical protein